MAKSETASESLSTSLPESHGWSARPTPGDLAALPGGPAVFLLTDARGAPVQLATTQALKRLLVSRLSDPQRQRPGKVDLAEITRGVRWRPLGTAFEGRWWYYRLAREMYPKEYRRLISFGPARFLHVDWAQRVSELRVTERIWCVPGEFVGPWPTQKACQEALEGLWDLFDLCRCPEQVRQAPHGTPCAYAEMGRCDAPCDGSTPLAAYVARCRAAWDFAAGGCSGWIDIAEARMQRAAARQEYEQAALIQRQLKFARSWQARWAPRVRPAPELNYLLGLPVTRRRAWKFLLFRTGHLTDGPVVPERRLDTEAAGWLREELSRTPAELSSIVRMEQTWLWCHLLFSRDVEAAVLIVLPNLNVPADLENTLIDKAKRVRARAQRVASRPRVNQPEDGADDELGNRGAHLEDSNPNGI